MQVLLNIENYFFTCPSKYFMGFDCPGCGLQRSIAALLEGNIGESLVLYPATIPMIFTLIFTALHIKFNFKHGADIIKISFIATALTVASFFIYKIITNKLI